MTKLNLGSGTSRYKDYISVDMHTDADVIHDLTVPLPYGDNSVEAIYSSHVAEHFTRAEWEDVRKDWARVIQPGGTIEIRCPDIYEVCLDLTESVMASDNEQYGLALARMYGQQGSTGQLHKNGFTKATLARSFPGFSYEVLEGSTEYELHMLFTKTL